jgi:vacuolar-type H+-ATPase subunit F/Vma7
MKQIACLGSEAFTLGFQLAGVRHTSIVHDTSKILDQIYELQHNKEIGIVIVDEQLLAELDTHDRSIIEDMVDPVFIPLSTESSSASLRSLIIKSIGVDLWKE